VENVSSPSSLPIKLLILYFAETSISINGMIPICSPAPIPIPVLLSPSTVCSYETLPPVEVIFVSPEFA
jgi:hypothetical protein